MSIEVKKQCVVCAWRESCNKKFTIKDSAMNCPDFSRDQSFPPEEESAAASEKSHKKIDDVFGDS